MKGSNTMDKSYKAELLKLALFARNSNITLTIKGQPGLTHTITSMIRSNIITGCTIDGTAYDFNCTGSIWDSTEYNSTNQMIDAGNVNE